MTLEELEEDYKERQSKKLSTRYIPTCEEDWEGVYGMPRRLPSYHGSMVEVFDATTNTRSYKWLTPDGRYEDL